MANRKSDSRLDTASGRILKDPYGVIKRERESKDLSLS